MTWPFVVEDPVLGERPPGIPPAISVVFPLVRGLLGPMGNPPPHDLVRKMLLATTGLRRGEALGLRAWSQATNLGGAGTLHTVW